MDLPRDHLLRKDCLRDDLLYRHGGVGQRETLVQRDSRVENGVDVGGHVGSEGDGDDVLQVEPVNPRRVATVAHPGDGAEDLRGSLLADCSETQGCMQRRRGGCRRCSQDWQ